MDPSTLRRRRRLGLVALVVGALASAATGASPSPSPNLTTSHDGTLHLTADHPVAWIEAEAVPNAAVIDSGSKTSLLITAQAEGPGVLLIASDTASRTAPNQEASQLSHEIACFAGEDCVPAGRLMAILLDPVAHPAVDVGWTASAETRFPETGPVPDAAIDVETSEPQTRPAADAGLAITAPERIELGPDTPRAIRTVRLTLPDGPPVDPILDANAFLQMSDLREDPAFRVPAIIRVMSGDEVVGQGAYPTHLPPFTTCEPGAACEVDLSVVFDWVGGADEVAPIEWSFAAWSGMSAEAADPAREPATIVVGSTDVAWREPPLSATTAGQTRVTRDGGARHQFTATLDLSDVPRGVDAVEGAVRLALRADLAPDSSPDADIRMSVGRDFGSVPIRPGEEAIAYSRIEDIRCTGGSMCSVEFTAGLSRDAQEDPEASVDWTAAVEFLSLAGEMPPAARLTVEYQPAP